MKRSWIAIAVVVATLTLGMLYVFRPNQQVTYTNTSTKEPERGSGQPSFIDDKNKLSDLLLPEQYLATRDEMISYATATYGKGIKSITIVGDPTVDTDGSVLVKVQIVDKNKQFTVKIVREAYDTLVFTVPAANYSKNLNIYKVDD